METAINNLFLTDFAQAPAGGGMPMFVFLILMMAAMWFLMIAPQRKKQKQHAKLIEELTSGDEILTASGIYGTITNVKDDRFVVRIAENTKIEIQKSFVQTKIDPASAK